MNDKSAASADAMAAALRRAEEYDEQIAHGLVGAVIGDWFVNERVKPRHRWVYLATNRQSGVTKGFQGCQLVRLARAARLSGLPVVLARPWRDESAVA
ncbi:MAG: hypothetical protein NTX33_19950 [Propionibacteriales bacterium]|nr:hypothetical protein [Propionibacteriales bacterium]